MKRRELLKVSFTFVTVGSAIAVLPAKILLSFDRRSGYAIYQKTFKSTGSEEKALGSAAKFYRLFGSFFILLGAVFSMIALGTSRKTEIVDQKEEHSSG